LGCWAGNVGDGFGGLRNKAKEMGAKRASIEGQLLRSVVEGERDGEVGRLINKDGILVF